MGVSPKAREYDLYNDRNVKCLKGGVMMKALLLAGGQGTRLHPLTYNLPKPMVPVMNRPWLEYLLDLLVKYDVREVVISLCYRPECIINYFGDGSKFGVNIKYVVEKIPLGTGGAIKYAAEGFTETFLVLNADVVTDMDLGLLLEAHRQKGAAATIAVYEVDDPTPYGLVETGGDLRITRFVEKPSPQEITTRFINAGVYAFEPEILRYIPEGCPVSIEREVYPALLERGVPVFAYSSRFYWMDLGTHMRYLLLHKDIFEGKVSLNLGPKSPQKIRLGERVKIHPTAQISGPVVIGDGATVGPGVRLGPLTVLGEGVSVGERSIIRNSVIWANTVIGKLVRLERAIVGQNYTVKDGRRLFSMVVANA